MTPRRVKRKNINSKYSSPHTYQPEQHQQLSSFNRKTTLLRNSRLSGTSSTRRQRISTLRDPVSKFFDHQRHHSVHEGSKFCLILKNFLYKYVHLKYLNL